ncbi:polysaccharide pyruvyl transferase family protein (plasmid) [Priestia aryabhattai]|uniref:polysaccharide pyruvyl transferase family protein n=1 Tax=Priestia aryabhattai TaxID=412384 RepID=UPI003D7FD06D
MKFVIHGYYGAGNVGDDAILENMIESLYREFPNAQFWVVSRGIFPAYRGNRNVETVNINSFTLVKELIIMADVVIVGGGGILHDYSNWEPQNEVGTKAKGMNYYGQIVNLAHQYGKKIYFYSIGIGPLSSPQSKDYACSLLSKASRITVRDAESYKFIIDNLPESEVAITADPALNIKSISNIKAKKLLKVEKIPSNKELVGICLRPWIFKGNEQEELLNRIAEIGNLLSNKENVHLVLLPFSQHKSDIQIMVKLAKKLPKRTYTLLKKNYHPQSLKGILGEFSLIIGMRLHSLILGASMGVPIIGISYDPKVNHFTSMLGPNIFSFAYPSLQTKKLFDLSAKLIRMSNADRKEFKNKVLHLKRKEELNIKFLFKEKEPK